MIRLLSLIAAVSLIGGIASAAADKGTEFKFGGEIRQRFFLNNNPTFQGSSTSFNEEHFAQRGQFHINAVSGDKLQAYFNMIHAVLWGANGSQPGCASTTCGGYSSSGTGAPGGTASTTNFTPSINEAWLWWKTSDNMAFKSGRMSLNWGDGALFSKNDWEQVPYSFDSVWGRYSMDFMDLDFGGGKLSESGITTARTDNEVVFYGLYGSIKNLPEVLKNAEVFLFQFNSDGSYDSVATPELSAGTQWNLMTFGARLKGEMSMIDYGVNFALQSGKQKGTTDKTFSGYMYDVKVGVNFPEFMKGRAYLGYHMDTGNDSTSADKSNGYQPMYYDRHTTGLMNMVAWGNLTQISAGLGLHPMEDTAVGVDFFMHTRSTDKAGAYINTTAMSSNNTPPTATSTDKNLGSEIDIWAKHSYSSAFNMLAGFGFYNLGSYYKATGATTGNAAQFLVQGTYTF